MKRNQLKTCPCLRSQLHTNVFGNLVIAQQTYSEVREAPFFCREDSSEEGATTDHDHEADVPKRRSSLSALGRETEAERRDSASSRRHFRRALSEEVIREHPDEAEAKWPTWSTRGERVLLQGRRKDAQLSRKSSTGERDSVTRRRSSAGEETPRKLSDDVISEEDVWSAREERQFLQKRWKDGRLSRGSSTEEEDSLSRRCDGGSEASRRLSDDVISEEDVWSAREERQFLQRKCKEVRFSRGSSTEEEDSVSTRSNAGSETSRRLSDDVISEEDVWSARVEMALRGRDRKNTYHAAQLSRGSSTEEEAAGRRRSTTDLDDGKRRRVSELVDQLLLDIYGRCGRRVSAGSSAAESDGCSASAASSWCWRTEGYRPGQDGAQRAAVGAKGVPELRTMLETLRLDVQMAGARLVRQLKKRDRSKARQAIQNSMVTAYLQAVSKKRSEDTKMRFSLVPYPGDSGFNQWHDAMKMVARLPGGIPPEFRRRLWLTLAERHLQDRGVDWTKMQRFCFNEWTNPDDDELGVQIVKDLHRTGCSLFCGAAAEENQALLKRVLLAYARWNKAVGYCQGFNMLAALILQVMDRSESDAVKVMIHLIEGVLPESYFANNLRGLSVDMAVFRDLLRLRLPALSRHLEQLQHDAGDSATGTSYEPPLTNVFTMQWFLTLFSNCLPQTTVLRVWDLIFLEGNEVLLRTALAIWDGLADRIMAVESADEFYSIMGVLTREMLEFGLMDANHLVKTIVTIAPFPFPELPDLRDKYLYNITPWTQTVSTAARRGLRLFYSDDDDDTDEDDEKIAVAAAYGISTVFRSPRRRDSVNRAPSPTTSLSTLSYSCAAPDRDRLALDISALKQQYAKLRERQRQAHIILTAACSRQSMGPSAPTPVAMNHLLLGKSALLNVRGRRMGPLPGAVPPLRSAPQGRLLAAASRAPHPERKPHSGGETLHWKDAAKRRQKKEADDDSPEVPTEGAVDTNERETSQMCDDDTAQDSDDDKSSSSSSSSTSTELCDEPDRLSDFDSEEPTSVSDASSYIPPPDNLLKIPSPSTDVSSSPSPDLCPPAVAFKSHPSPTDDAVLKDTRTDTQTALVYTDDTVVPNKAVSCEILTVTTPELDLPLSVTDYSSAANTVISSPLVSEHEKRTSPHPATQEHVSRTNEDRPIPVVSIEDADIRMTETIHSKSQDHEDNDGNPDSTHEKTTGIDNLHNIYYRSTQGLTNIINEISNSSLASDISLVGENFSRDKHLIKKVINSNSPTTTFPHDHYRKQLSDTFPSERNDETVSQSLHSESNGDQNLTAVYNFLNEKQEITEGPVTIPTIITEKCLKVTESCHSGTTTLSSSPNESLETQETEISTFDINYGYETQKSIDMSNITETTEKYICKSATVLNDMKEHIGEDISSGPFQNYKIHVPVTVVIQSDGTDDSGEVSGRTDESIQNNVGRRKSERALKIIQENFEILQRITQCHGRHSDRLLDANTSTEDGDDILNDVRSSSSDHSIDDLCLVTVTDKISPTTNLQTDMSDSMTGGVSLDRPTPIRSQSKKFEFFNFSNGMKCHNQSSDEVLKCADTNKSQSQSNFVFKGTESGNQDKDIILLEGKSYDKAREQTHLKLNTQSTVTPWGEKQMEVQLTDSDEYTTYRQIVKCEVQDDSDLKSKYTNFSQKSAAISEGSNSSLHSAKVYHTISAHEDMVSPNSSTIEHKTKFSSDLSETKLNGNPSLSYPFKRFDDKRRLTIHTFDSKDRDALRTFNCQDDTNLEKFKSFINTERLSYTTCDDGIKQFTDAKDSHSPFGSSVKNIRAKSHNFLVKDVIDETQKSEGKNSYSETTPGSYSFLPRNTYSSERFTRDCTPQDKNSPSKRWSTGALCSDDVVERYRDQADRPSTEATDACKSFSSSPETATRKSQLSLAVGVSESSRLQPPAPESSEVSLSRQSSPQTVSSQTLEDCTSSESAYILNSESQQMFENRSVDRVSSSSARGAHEMNKLFMYNSWSGQLKSPPCSPIKGKDVVSSFLPIKSTVLNSPTRNCKKYDPFPPRASLRQPKEIGIKLGLYSTSEADRKNSSKKP